jgi:hypothetical protein
MLAAALIFNIYAIDSAIRLFWFRSNKTILTKKAPYGAFLLLH